MKLSNGIHKPLANLIQDRAEEAVLVIEIIINGPFAESRTLDNLVIRSPFKTSFREFLYRCIHQPHTFGVVQSFLSDYKNHLLYDDAFFKDYASSTDRSDLLHGRLYCVFGKTQ